MLNPKHCMGGMILSALLAITFAAGCQTADLRTDAMAGLEPGADDIENARNVYTAALERLGGYDKFRRFKTKKLKGTDIWYSGWVRWLTPVTETRQTFEVHIQSDPPEIRYRFLNGKRQGEVIGVDQTGAYSEAQGERKHTDSSSIRLYLEPLRDYFEWPFTLLDSRLLLHAGSRTIRGRRYDLIFATDGGMAPSEQYDQFIVYIDHNTGRIDYVEFTLRELTQSYRGTLHYTDYREVAGLWVPFTIGVGDTVEDEAHVHVFEFDQINFMPGDQARSLPKTALRRRPQFYRDVN
jgi:hypothetical protein